MITLRKNGAKLEFVKNVSGIIIHIHEKSKISSFCIVPPGNIFILVKGKWIPIEETDNTNIIHRKYIDPVDKASVEMRNIIEKTAHIKFLNYEKFFVEKVIYEFFTNLDLFNWFPGYGEAVFIEMLHNKMVAHYKDGKTEDFDMTKAANSVILPFDEPIKLPVIKLPPLPPLGPIAPISPPITKSITLPPLVPMSLIKSLPPGSPIDISKTDREVKLIVSNDLSVPININEEPIEVSTSLPLVDDEGNDIYDVTTEELTETDDE
jgi:hypothetical protein